jgi:ubiquinone/menaquinone biosynthesis C-methylase UbiE
LRTRDYYDEFSAWYEKERGRGYHQLIDDLEVDMVARYGRGAAVLEAGCGTGLLLERVAGFAAKCWGIDLSAKMLAPALRRRLNVVQGSVTDLPFPSESFDVVYSFKVLPHVEPIREALAELARVTRRGGYLLLEFYNPLSLRYLVKRLKPASRISEQATDAEVFTRYDGLDDVKGYLPPSTQIVTMRGVRIATPVSHVYRVAPLGLLFNHLERRLADFPGLRRLGGFLIVVAQKL